MLADEYPEIDSRRAGDLAAARVLVHHRSARCRRFVPTRDRRRCNRRAACCRSVPRQPHGIGARSVRPSLDAEHAHRRLRSCRVRQDQQGRGLRVDRRSAIEAPQRRATCTTSPCRCTTSARAQAFFSAVLGWQFPDPTARTHRQHLGTSWRHRQVEPVMPRPARSCGSSSTTSMPPSPRSASSAAAPTDPVHYDCGWSADCVDDQGTTFNLSVPAAKYTL